MTETPEIKKITVFDFLNDITVDKKYLFTDDTESVYNPYIVGMGLMQHSDTCLLANEANKICISKEAHHDFLFYSVTKSKRYGKWAKADKTDEDIIEYLKAKYAVNQEVAKSYLKLMDEETKQQTIDTMNSKGGKK